MDWKLLLASLSVLVINVSAQLKGGDCTYNGVKYGVGFEWDSVEYPGCKCKCLKAENGGVPKVDCKTGQCDNNLPCLHEGRTHKYDSKWTSSDGCTDCICKAKQRVECSSVQCKTPAPTPPTPAPVINCKSPETGAIMAPGAVVESKDKCKLYRCYNGQVQVQNKACTCSYNGQTLAIGTTFNIECNTCRCGVDLRVTCSQNPCPCTFNGVSVPQGSSVPTPDGCNTCTCGANSQMSCTQKPCQCTYNGQVYKIKQQFSKGDNCNTCTCNEDGNVSCTEKKCTCIENGVTYTVGQTFKKDCNTCRCTETGVVVCTLMACGCAYNGRNVAVGETIMSGDGCTRLRCNQNGANMVSDNGVNCPCIYNGMQYPRGQSFAKPGDSCGNTCNCDASTRQVTCTSNACCRNPMTNAVMQVGAFYMNECNRCNCMQSGTVQCENKPCYCTGTAGQKYTIGLSWIHSDGCNTCTCLQTGEIACDNKECQCRDGGSVYPIDSTFMHADGCQTCKCTVNAVIQCDNKICNCNHEGRVVQIGAIFDKGDGCNQCQCMQNGQVSCSTNAVPCKCQWNGMELNIGQTRPQDCNLCTCLSSGNVQCTNKPCDCNYNGRRYAFGKTFQKSTAPQDACNTCTCQNSGQVQCTSNKCGCDVGGSVIDPGTVFNQDECNTCTCMANFQLSCTNNPNPCNCKYGTMTYSIGQEFLQGNDQCTKCRCNENGRVTCANTCPIQQDPECTYNGRKLKIGETFKNDCNTCQCQRQGDKGVINCTKKVCGCRGANGRIYKAGESWQLDKCTSCTCQQTPTSYARSCKKNPGCKV